MSRYCISRALAVLVPVILVSLFQISWHSFQKVPDDDTSIDDYEEEDDAALMQVRLSVSIEKNTSSDRHLQNHVLNHSLTGNRSTPSHSGVIGLQLNSSVSIKDVKTTDDVAANATNLSDKSPGGEDSEVAMIHNTSESNIATQDGDSDIVSHFGAVQLHKAVASKGTPECPSYWGGVGLVLSLCSFVGLGTTLVLCILTWWVCLPEGLRSLGRPDRPGSSSAVDARGTSTASATPAPTRAVIEDGTPVHDQLRWLSLAIQVMVFINFTIMMPTSHVVAESNGAGLGASGFFIGCYAFGAMMSIPLVIRFAKQSFRDALLSTVAAAFIGNLCYMYAKSVHSQRLMNMARVICGWEGGSALLLAHIGLRCCTGLAQVQFYAEVSTSACVGLLLGPSLSSTANALLGEQQADLGAAAIMVAYSFSLGVAVIRRCPPMSECIKLTDKNIEEANEKQDLSTNTAWLSLALLCCINLTRSFQRVFWEAAFLYIIAEVYGYGTQSAGYLTAIPFVLLLNLPWAGRYLRKTCGCLGMVKFLEAMQLAGILVMIQIPALLPKHTKFEAAFLIIGSAMFYSANWAMWVAVGPIQAYFSIPSHMILNIETIPAFTWGAGFFGYFVGPIAARYVLNICACQNMLPIGLLASSATAFIGQQVALSALAPSIRD